MGAALDAMTSVRVSLVDVYVLRPSPEGLRCLVLRRAPGGRCPGSWETVHGHIEEGERPWEVAARELEEETGMVPERLYNLSRVESFYLHRRDAVALVGVFVAFVNDEAPRLGGEHDASEWLPWKKAAERLAWPREVRCLEDAVRLLGRGDAGPVEDVLRIC